MMVMSILTYPLKSSTEVGKKFVEALKKNPAPDYVNRLEIYVRYGGKGIQAFSPTEITKGKEDEGIKWLVEWYVQFYEIEGVEVELPIVLTAAEALPMIGMSM